MCLCRSTAQTRRISYYAQIAATTLLCKFKSVIVITGRRALRISNSQDSFMTPLPCTVHSIHPLPWHPPTTTTTSSCSLLRATGSVYVEKASWKASTAPKSNSHRVLHVTTRMPASTQEGSITGRFDCPKMFIGARFLCVSARRHTGAWRSGNLAARRDRLDDGVADAAGSAKASSDIIHR